MKKKKNSMVDFGDQNYAIRRYLPNFSSLPDHIPGGPVSLH